MKLPFKILFINLAVVFLISLLFAFSMNSNGRADEFLMILGLCALGFGFLALIIGVILLIAKSGESAKGFLISAGVLFLLGFASCGIGLSNLNFH